MLSGLISKEPRLLRIAVLLVLGWLEQKWLRMMMRVMGAPG